MAKSQTGNNDNGNGSVFMPLQNALGIENWPQSIQEECRRVTQNDEDRVFIPFEDYLVSGLNGEALTSFWDLIGAQDVKDERYQALCDACNYEPKPYVEEDEEDDSLVDFLASLEEEAEERGEVIMAPAMSPDEIKMLQALREIISALSGDEPVSFHGTSRAEVTPGTKKGVRMIIRGRRARHGLRAHLNTKKNKPRVHKETARSVLFEMQVVEESAIANMAFREEKFAFARAAA
jgi:hypothetical protein